MPYVWAVLLCIVNAVWFVTIIPGLPGTWLMIGSTVFVALWWRGGTGPGEPGMFNIWTLVAILAIAGIAELVEFLAGVAGSKRAGGRGRGAVGAAGRAGWGRCCNALHSAAAVGLAAGGVHRGGGGGAAAGVLHRAKAGGFDSLRRRSRRRSFLWPCGEVGGRSAHLADRGRRRVLAVARLPAYHRGP